MVNSPNITDPPASTGRRRRSSTSKKRLWSPNTKTPKHAQTDNGRRDIKDELGRPETVVLAVKAWAFVLFFEVIHQIIEVIEKILNREETAHQIIQKTGDPQINSDATQQLHVEVFIIIGGAIAIVFVGIIFALVNSFNKATKRAFWARRALAFYGLYLGVRIVFIYTEISTIPANSLPIAFSAIDGAIAITVGVIALVAVVLGARDDSLKWVGETPVGFSPPPNGNGHDEKKDERKK